MNNQHQRLAPLPPQKWSDDLAEIRQRLATPLNIHNMMAHHPELTLAWMNFRDHIVRDSSLTARQRELLILQTARNCQAEYEWVHHVIRGRQAGLSEAEIERIKEATDLEAWHKSEALLLQVADEFYRDFKMSDSSYSGLSAHFDAKQLLDICCTVGMYMTLALIIKSFKVPLEEHFTRS